MEKRGLQLAQLNGGDAQGPDVTELIVASFAFHGGHLWGHPREGVTEGMAKCPICAPPHPVSQRLSLTSMGSQ